MTDSIQLVDTSKELDEPIQFISTPAANIAGHIAGNARCRNEECDMILPCQCDPQNRIPMVQRDRYRGLTVVIAGAGPSLSKAHKQIKKADHVWGCNSAANWIQEKGWKLTHAVAIDAGSRMFGECWKEPPDADYLIATTVSPPLVDHLLEHGKSIEYFHSRRCTPDEEILCRDLYPPAPMCENGLNVVNRAVQLAVYMGYRKILVAGADSSIGEGDVMYVDGRKTVDNDVIVEGTIDGRMWRTKPDMLLSAICLVEMKWALGTRMEFIGNVLPKSLARKNQAFLDRCIRWIAPDEQE